MILERRQKADDAAWHLLGRLDEAVSGSDFVIRELVQPSGEPDHLAPTNQPGDRLLRDAGVDDLSQAQDAVFRQDCARVFGLWAITGSRNALISDTT